MPKISKEILAGGKKDKSKKAEVKKGKFDWLKNLFKKSEKEKK